MIRERWSAYLKSHGHRGFVTSRASQIIYVRPVSDGGKRKPRHRNGAPGPNRGRGVGEPKFTTLIRDAAARPDATATVPT